MPCGRSMTKTTDNQVNPPPQSMTGRRNVHHGGIRLGEIQVYHQDQTLARSLDARTYTG